MEIRVTPTINPNPGEEDLKNLIHKEEMKINKNEPDEMEIAFNDMVNHPRHYIQGGLETIDVIEAFTQGLEGIEAVCTANAIKYICRWKNKNGVEDLKKAQWYINHLIEKLEKPEEKNDER